MGTGEETLRQTFTWTFSRDGRLEHVQREDLLEDGPLVVEDVHGWDEHGRLVDVVQTRSDTDHEVVTRATYGPGGWMTELETTGVTWSVGDEDSEETFQGLTTFRWDREQAALTGRHAILEGIPWGIDYDDTFVCR